MLAGEVSMDIFFGDIIHDHMPKFYYILINNCFSLFYIFFPDFDMSDAQQEHALAVERLAPRLAALRIELCPGHMSEGCFWKIYFVLLHSRLNKHDAELLSTPQVSCLILCTISV